MDSKAAVRTQKSLEKAYEGRKREEIQHPAFVMSPIDSSVNSSRLDDKLDRIMPQEEFLATGGPVLSTPHSEVEHELGKKKGLQNSKTIRGNKSPFLIESRANSIAKESKKDISPTFKDLEEEIIGNELPKKVKAISPAGKDKRGSTIRGGIHSSIGTSQGNISQASSQQQQIGQRNKNQESPQRRDDSKNKNRRSQPGQKSSIRQQSNSKSPPRGVQPKAALRNSQPNVSKNQRYESTEYQGEYTMSSKISEGDELINESKESPQQQNLSVPQRKTILKSKTMSKKMLRQPNSEVDQDQAYSQASAAHQGLSMKRKEELQKNQVSQMVGLMASSPAPSNHPANRLDNYRVSFPDSHQINLQKKGLDPQELTEELSPEEEDSEAYEIAESEVERRFEENTRQLYNEKQGLRLITELQAASNLEQQQFFVVLDKDELEAIQEMEGRCLCLRKTMRFMRTIIQRIAYAIIKHWIFETISIIVIVANSLVLAAENPTIDPEFQDPIFKKLDDAFLILYTIEMVLKILGLGFLFNQGAYLRDSWNILDFTIVVSAYVSVFASGGGGGLAALRAFRVLRPLKTISSIEGLRIIVSALFSSMSLLRDTIIVLLFFFVIFAICGLNLFSGVLKKRCINTYTGIKHPDDMLCGVSECPPMYFCGKRNESPNFGQTNFDNIFYSLISIFQSVTLEGWSVIMQMVWETYTPFAFIFFIPLVFIGAFFLLNLTLAVIKSKFSEAHDAKQSKIDANKGTDKVSGHDIDIDAMKPEAKKKYLEDQAYWSSRVNRRLRAMLRVKTQMRKYIKDFRKRKALGQLYCQSPESKIYQKYNPRQLKIEEGVTPQMSERSERDHETVNFSTKFGHVVPKLKMTEVINQNHAQKNTSVNPFYAKFKQPRNLGAAAERILRDLVQSVDIQGIEEGKADDELMKIAQHLEVPTERSEDRQRYIESSHRSNFQTGRSRNSESSALKTEESQLEEERRQKRLREERKAKVLELPHEKEYQEKLAATTQKQIDLSDPQIQPIQISMDQGIEQRLGTQNETDQQQERKGPQFELLRAADSRGSEASERWAQITGQLSNQQDLAISNNAIGKIYNTEKDEHKEKIFEALKKTRNTGSNLRQKMAVSSKIDSYRTNYTNPLNITDDQAIKKKTVKIRKVQPIEQALDDPLAGKLDLMRAGNVIRDQIGKFKKILVRNDQILFTSQRDILEEREKKRLEELRRKEMMDLAAKQAKKKSKKFMEGDHNWKVKGYQRKTWFKQKPVQPDDVGQDMIQRFAIDPLDVDFIIQDRYDIGFRSNQFVTGTLSISIQPIKGLDPSGNSRPSSASSRISRASTLTDRAKQIRMNTNRKATQIGFRVLPQDMVNYLDNKPEPEKTEEQLEKEKEEMKSFFGLFEGGKQPSEISSQGPKRLQTLKSDLSTGKQLAIKMAKFNEKPLTEKDKEAIELEAFFERLTKTQISMSSKKRDGIFRQPRTKAIGSMSPLRIDTAKGPSRQDSKIPQIRNSKSQNLSNFNRGGGSKAEPRVQTQQTNARKAINRESTFISQVTQGVKKFEEKQALKDFKILSAVVVKKTKKYLCRSKLHQDTFNLIRKGEIVSKVLKDANKVNVEIEEDESEDSEFLDDNGDYIELEDEFLDNEIDHKKQIRMARQDLANFKKQQFEWSGQDVLQDFDPQMATAALKMLNGIRVWPATDMHTLKKLQSKLKDFTKSSFFDNLMTLCVLLNTICLALDRYGQSQESADNLTLFNEIFTWIFIVEMGLKLLGQGIFKYMADKMNYLDGAVVLLSIFEMTVMSGGGGATSAFRTVRIFRTFRVLRVARLLRGMQSMQVIIGVLIKSMSSFMYLALLLLLFCFIYSLLGMQIFGNQFNFDDVDGSGEAGVPRANYDSFQSAFITVFIVLTMENWQVILYDSMRSNVGAPVACLYLISWIFLGNFMILNLFLAILLDSFTTESPEDANKDLKMLNMTEKEQERQERADNKKEMTRVRALRGVMLIEEYTKPIWDPGSKKASLGGKKKKKGKGQPGEENILDQSFELDTKALVKKKKKNKQKTEEEIIMFSGIACHRSFYLFSQQNWLRKKIYIIVTKGAFEHIILVLIILSSLKLVVDTYTKGMDPNSTFMIAAEYSDTFFTFAFALESLMKATAFGFAMDTNSYLRDSWSQLDFFIVVTSLIDFSFAGLKLSVFKILRMLRTLRPLRFISHNSSMKTVVMALLTSVDGIFNVAIVVMIIWMMFAIFAVNIFGGKLQYCTVDPYVHTNELECLYARGKWTTYDSNFDSVPLSMMTLFIVASLEGWPDIMFATVDATGVEQGPKLDASPLHAYFFVIFIFVGSFLFLNLFIGVIFMKFQEAQDEEQNQMMLNEDQTKWVDMMKMIVKASPDLETTTVPKVAWKRKIHRFVTYAEKGSMNKFDIFIMVCIVLNMFQMAANFEGSSDTYQFGLEILNYIFTVIFIIEAVLKLLAFGKSYFKSSWNVFDFTVVCFSIFDIVLGVMDSKSLAFLRVGPQLARVMRVLRVSRVFRLMNKFEGLQALVETITFSLPSLMNVLALLMLFYFIFAVLGNFLFGEVQSGEVIDSYTNFKNFGYSMIILMRVSTGEDWNKIMYDVSRVPPNCIPGETCGSEYAFLFFIIFIMVCSFIMLNLFILVIIQQFELYYLPPTNVIKEFKTQLELFKKVWTIFTLSNNCIKIKESKLISFFSSIEEPLGLVPKKRPGYPEKQADKKLVTREIVKMDLEADEEGFVYFNELLFKSMKRAFGEKRITNKILADQETKTAKKIHQLKEKYMREFNKAKEKKKKQEELDQSLAEEQNLGSVNPFLQMMYLNMTAKAWRRATQENLEMRLEDKEKQMPYRILDIESEHSEYTDVSSIHTCSDCKSFSSLSSDEEGEQEKSEDSDSDDLSEDQDGAIAELALEQDGIGGKLSRAFREKLARKSVIKKNALDIKGIQSAGTDIKGLSALKSQMAQRKDSISSPMTATAMRNQYGRLEQNKMQYPGSPQKIGQGPSPLGQDKARGSNFTLNLLNNLKATMAEGEQKKLDKSGSNYGQNQNSSFFPSSSNENSRIKHLTSQQTSYFKNTGSAIASKVNSKDVSRDMIKR